MWHVPAVTGLVKFRRDTPMTTHKMTWMTGAALVLAAASIVPAAHAQDQSYDGYCYAKKDSAKTTGTVVGAIAGGLLGSQISKNERGLGTVGGAVIGGVVGRSIGSASVKCMNGEYYSYQSGYYSPATPPDGYDVVYYKARPDNSTYSTVYYDQQRHTSPGYAYNSGQSNSNSQRYNNGQPYNNGQSYSSGYNDGQPNNGHAYDGQPSNTGYNGQNGTPGWRDTSGYWHSGRVTTGWKDTRGQWHEGQARTGYQDRNGTWHEVQQQQGYNGSADYTPNY